MPGMPFLNRINCTDEYYLYSTDHAKDLKGAMLIFIKS